MSNPNPRKRAAPGAAPMIPMQQPMQPQYQAPNMPGDQMVRWNPADPTGGFLDASGNPGNSYELVQNPQYAQNLAASSSNSIARRPNNRQLVPANNFDPSWFMGDEGALVPQNQEENGGESDNIEELEERAQKVKRDAQGKRNGIPPFVQKLSSFLEEGKNEDLIRWSEKGDSFIVLDEDEFARTLIPELFKHNNYASFVRQLNMYGFHKRVGLSDNSMRASERKNKSPSEYSNPYFRRGHPNLLWLINKPKSGNKKKDPQGKNSEEPDAADDAGQDEIHAQPQGSSHPHVPKSLPPAGEGAPPKKEMGLIQNELKQLREQQKVISRTISQLQQNNHELYKQAMMFQSQHDRHQNSINAILHFLANLFRKSLEEQGSSHSNQNIGDILSSMLANQGQQAQQGNVVDLGDYFQNQTDPGSTTLAGTPHRRARGLLPPIPDQNDTPRTTRSPSMGRSQYHPMGGQSHETGQVTELADGPSGDTPPNLKQELENNPQEQMMRIINDHNATNSSGMDLPEAAEFVANAPQNMNQDQRNQLANFMSRQSSTPSAAGRSSATPNPPPTNQTATSTSKPKSTVSPSPGNTGGDNAAAPSLSPIMRSPAMPPMSINQINTNQQELERLQELQQQQDSKINELTDILGPLSPSGRIPALDDNGNDPYFDQNVDLDQYFNDDAFLNDGTFGGGGDMNTNFDNTDNLFGMPQMGTDNAGNNVNTPSPTGTEEIQREDFDNGGDTPSKRRRMG